MKDKNLLRAPKGEWGEGYINFTSNDYLGLAKDKRVVAAGIAAAEKYGAGAGASRIAGGDHPLFAEFAKDIAAFKAYEAATVFGSGYLANIGIITALEPGIIYADKLVHACIIDAAKLSGAKLVRFKHNDMADLKRLMTEPGLIITEEIFSMDGDAAPLQELRRIANESGCILMVDGAHSLYDKKAKLADIYVGTMSKALGSYGGYVCGSKTLIKYLETKARPLIYSTGLPPFAVGAALKALQIAENEKLYLKVLENAQLLRGNSAIIPIILGSEDKALAAEEILRHDKILVSAIRPPTVPKGTSRLRVSVTAAHKKSEIDLLAEKLKRIL